MATHDKQPGAVGSIHLVIKRTIRASPQRIFDAWTTPDQLTRWWGPRDVICSAAEVDLQEGGSYRLANTFPDGSVVWILGEFERIDRPRELVYSWRLAEQASGTERVTLSLAPVGDGTTEVTVIHEKIADEQSRDQHRLGWCGCLDGLASYLGSGDAR